MSLAFYAQFADVVVLARELNLEQVRQIHEQIEKRHLWTQWKTDPHRDVLSSCIIQYSCLRKVLFIIA